MPNPSHMGVEGRPNSCRSSPPLGSGEAGIRERDGTADRGVGMALSPLTEDDNVLRDELRDDGRRMLMPKMVVLEVMPKLGVVRPDSEIRERETTRVEPVVEAGVTRPEAGISTCDSIETARNAEGGGLSYDCRERSLENEGR